MPDQTAEKLNKYTPETVDYTLSGLRIPIKEGSILRIDTGKYGVLDVVVRNGLTNVQVLVFCLNLLSLTLVHRCCHVLMTQVID